MQEGEGVRDAPLDMILNEIEKEAMENEGKDYPFNEGKMWEVDEIPCENEQDAVHTILTPEQGKGL